MATNELHNKYRPTCLTDVLGQEVATNALQRVLKKGTAHSFVFTGPSGCGKTTLARIVANAVGCTKQNLMEVDAATHTGIDAMRAVTEVAQYGGMGASSKRCIIIDEAHALSKAAWQSLLKSVEEPPDHMYWVFCTTEPAKIPKTIQTRCVTVAVKPVPAPMLGKLLKTVCKRERMVVAPDVLKLVATTCDGSPRQALTNLALVAGCKTKREAAHALQTAGTSKEAIDLCRLLMGKPQWSQCAELLKHFKDNGVDGEGVRRVVCGYMTSVALGTSSRNVNRALLVLDAFSQPYPPQSGVYPLVLSVGDVVLGG